MGKKNYRCFKGLRSICTGILSLQPVSALFRVYLILAVLVNLIGFAVVQDAAEGAPMEAPLEFSMPNGRFFTQTNGNGGGDGTGYRVTDEQGIPFWTAFQQLGGVDVVGYPVSQRFQWNGFTVQAFQKLVLQWRPDTGTISFVNIFDEMNLAGKDAWLRNVRSTPERTSIDENGKSWDQVVADRIAWLDANPSIKTKYLQTPDYLARYGLPTSRVEDVGNAYVVRFQRAVMQQWKVDVPWAKKGQVTVANGGDIGKEAGIYPSHAIQLETLSGAPVNTNNNSRNAMPANPRSLKVVIDPGHGGAEPGATHVFSDGSKLYEKDVNLRLAIKVGDELYRLGYNITLTRRSDVKVNGGRDVDGDGRLTVEDDLQARIDIANSIGADIFVSIHNNGIRDPNVRGTEVYYCAERPHADKSRKLAAFTQEELVRNIRETGYNTVDRGIKDDSRALGVGRHYYLLGPKNRLIVRPSNMPAIIGEGLFVSNDYEANLLRQDSFLTAMARGYVTAINRYFASEGK